MGTMGDGPLVPCPVRSCNFGCNPAHARTRTVPYCASSTVRSAVGVGQVAGSAQTSVCPCRKGRPPCGRGGMLGGVP